MAETYDFPVPRYLYRFRRDSERHVGEIEQSYLWCADFRSLNDPMEGLFRSADRSWREALRVEKYQTGICSLTEDPRNVLMWAHYSDQFNGFCVEYDTYALLEVIQSALLVRVRYSDDIPLPSLGGDPFESAKSVLSSKGSDWAYEREWRLLKRGAGRQHYDHSSLKVVSRILVGNRASQYLMKGLKFAAPTVPIERIRLRDGKVMIKREARDPAR
ncbi:DUF2971 domain-containing protein [Bosea sp. TND4EK4]|uniref:DUF2971 domain-containing protein n=1 Tax=Bosea sp. TND4EK4 TaxID=1907408 RepID=UPI000956CAF4|nr:DUF2971 domain-containing protein [Bosea sp. TND4EK4]SIP96357.1 Protein of unknown function [Bosea sp. TND4EK4]